MAAAAAKTKNNVYLIACSRFIGYLLPIYRVLVPIYREGPKPNPNRCSTMLTPDQIEIVIFILKHAVSRRQDARKGSGTNNY